MLVLTTSIRDKQKERMKKRNFKQFYVIINTQDGTIHVCSTKTKVAEIVGCHRSTVDSLEDRVCLNNCVIINVTEE